MYTKSRDVIAVFVFTAYDDGNVDVTMTAPFKDRFPQVQKAIGKIAQWCKHTIAQRDKCPYSPNNPAQLTDDNTKSQGHGDPP